MDRPASAQTRTGAENRLLTGWFNFFFEGERWEWSPEVARIHGYEPGAVSPTTDLVMKHKHPDDRPKMAAILEHVRRTREPISTRHRIIDTTGAIRDVIVLGEQLHDDPAGVIGIHGHYIDVTHTRPDGTGPDHAVNREITKRVERIHIGTHSASVESGLRELFGELKWVCLRDYPMGNRCETEYGEIAFQDGVQTWVNPSPHDPVPKESLS